MSPDKKYDAEPEERFFQCIREEVDRQKQIEMESVPLDSLWDAVRERIATKPSFLERCRDILSVWQESFIIRHAWAMVSLCLMAVLTINVYNHRGEGPDTAQPIAVSNTARHVMPVSNTCYVDYLDNRTPQVMIMTNPINNMTVIWVSDQPRPQIQQPRQNPRQQNNELLI